MNRDFLQGHSKPRQHPALPALRANSVPGTSANSGPKLSEAARLHIRLESAPHSKSNFPSVFGSGQETTITPKNHNRK